MSIPAAVARGFKRVGQAKRGKVLNEILRRLNLFGKKPLKFNF